MRTLLTRYREFYGSSPLHLLVMLAGFALFAYVIATVGLPTLWNPKVWWQSIAVWLAGALILHDLVLFPIYALADRLLAIPDTRRQPRVPIRNYIRVPVLGSGLMLLLFFPVILRLHPGFFMLRTGQSLDPFLQRWLWLTAAMFGASAVAYAVRLLRQRRSKPDTQRR